MRIWPGSSPWSVTSFDLWFPRVDGHRVLWPSAVQLSADYFDSLTRHAVPLHEIALAALSGNAPAAVQAASRTLRAATRCPKGHP